MAASRCMCTMLRISKLFGRSYHISPFSALVQPNRSYGLYRFNSVPSYFLSARCSNIIRIQSLSTQPPNNDSTSKPSNVKGLADQILQSKVDQSGSSSDQNSKKAEDEKAKSDEFNLRMMKYTMYFLGVFFAGTTGLLVVEWGAPQLDDKGNPIPDEYSNEPIWKAYLLRFWREVVFYDKLIKEPSRTKLLPDPLTEPYYQPPYTLVLEMTGVLVHPDWTYKTGWRFKKRPGVDFFLQQVAPPLFEVVIYTSEQGFTAMPILESLDPNGYIMYKLYRDATRYTKGVHIKDLDCLNRDLSKVILVDWNNNAFQLHPQNALRLRKWKGEDGDRTLVDLAVFLRTIATSNVEDVRLVLEHYGQFDDPLEAFKENQRRLDDEQRKRLEQVGPEDKPGVRTGSWLPSMLRRKSN